MFPIEIPLRDETDWSISLNASLNLFRGLGKIAEKQQALQELKRLQLEKSELKNRIEQRVRSAFHLAGVCNCIPSAPLTSKKGRLWFL